MPFVPDIFQAQMAFIHPHNKKGLRTGSRFNDSHLKEICQTCAHLELLYLA
jgi:hypothetical protein